MKEYSDFLPVNLAEELYDYAINVATNKTFPRALWTNMNWHESLTDGSSLVLCIRPTEDVEKKVEDFLINKNILDFLTDKPITQTGITVNIWGRGSFITQHSDHNYSKAITVYLNKDWVYNHGGIFHWKNLNDNTWNSVAPYFNKAVINGGGIPHGISPVQSDYRVTLQIFVHKST